jgi:2-polyprenyl-6-methoxyphenol hydroxylase-like FAD-dependent oxidoreductase
MEATTGKEALIAGASIAGLVTAYWLGKAGYRVTVVEQAPALRLRGAAVNLEGAALDVVKRMGLFAQLQANSLQLERWEFKNAADETAGALDLRSRELPQAGELLEPEQLEIEREQLLPLLHGALDQDVTFLFSNRLVALHETPAALHATFADGTQRSFDLVFGCDGLHSSVRRLWFGPEADYAHFLQHYFSLTIVPKSLVAPNTAQLYNVPGKAIMLNAYKQKTDICFCFFSETEIPYDYRDTAQQQALTAHAFAGQGWRTDELLAEVAQAPTAYFDKFCQIKMPSWTKGRVALVGDAGYCASPAAGMGGSLAMIGGAAVVEALAAHHGEVDAAFAAYNRQLRPLVEEVQAQALVMLADYLVPKTEEAIHLRNTQPSSF